MSAYLEGQTNGIALILLALMVAVAAYAIWRERR